MTSPIVIMISNKYR